jgi:hypothetical protein
MRWNFQNSNLKKELMDYLEGLFGVDMFNIKVVTFGAGEYLKYTQDVREKAWQKILGMSVLTQFQRESGRQSLMMQKKIF